MNNKQIKWIAGIILFTAFSRLIPHAPNFTPVLAIALFGGAYISNRLLSITIPLFAMFLSDTALHLINGYELFNEMSIVIYATLTIISMIGHKFNFKPSALNVAGTSVLSTTIFFITSNLMVFFADGLYPMDYNGLISCYVMAIPFSGNMLLSTLLYSAILFYGFEIAKKRARALAA